MVIGELCRVQVTERASERDLCAHGGSCGSSDDEVGAVHEVVAVLGEPQKDPDLPGNPRDAAAGEDECGRHAKCLVVAVVRRRVL